MSIINHKDARHVFKFILYIVHALLIDTLILFASLNSFKLKCSFFDFFNVLSLLGVHKYNLKSKEG